jgi:chromosome partitioning protein
VPNRVDRGALEGQQLVDELAAFGERVSPPIGNRTAFVRAFSSGHAISTWVGKLAHGEIRTLCDLVESMLGAAPVNPRLSDFNRFIELESGIH